MREPEIVAGCSMQLLAVTWNSGVGAMNTFCVGWPSASSRRRRFGVTPGFAAAEPGGAGHEDEVHQVVHRAAVGQLGALREPRGARRVEDAGIVVGVDRRRPASSAGAVAGSITSAHRDGIGRQFAVVANGDQVERAPRPAARRAPGGCARRARRRRSRRPGCESARPYFISSVVHHAFIPTQAAPSDTIAQ